MPESKIYNVDTVHKLYLHIDIQHFASLALDVFISRY